MTSSLATTRVPRQQAALSGCLLRCVFHKGPDAVTCAVEVTDTHSYEVCVLPHWNVSESVVEHFEAPAGAVRRHAEIARHLRQSGWVAHYGATHPTGVAA